MCTRHPCRSQHFANSLSLLVLEEHDITVVLDKRALSEGSPQREEYARGIVVVMVTKHKFDCLCNFGLIIERDHRKKVVGYMIMCDIMQEKPTNPAKERPVNRSESTSSERPLVPAVVGNCRVRMLEVREGDDPVIRKQPRYPVMFPNE